MHTKTVLVFISSVLGALFVFGTIGFRLVDPRHSLIDAFYMTTLVITTIGFGEVHKLSDFGRVFAIVLSLISFFVTMVSIGFVTYVAMDIRFDAILRRSIMKRRVAKLTDHFIVCGAGQVGSHVIHELYEAQFPFVVVERDREVMEIFHQKYPNLLYIIGDASEDEILYAAGVRVAKGLISVLDSDSHNLFVSLSARELSQTIRIISRATEPESIKKIQKAGADIVVSPNMIGALRMASAMIRPTVVSFLDIMMRETEKTLRMEEVDVPQDSHFDGKTLLDLAIPSKTGLMVVSVRDGKSGRYYFNPTRDQKIHSGDTLIVVGEPEQRSQLIELAKK